MQLDEVRAQRKEARELAKRLLPCFQGKTIEFCDETLAFLRFYLDEAHKNTPIFFPSAEEE